MRSRLIDQRFPDFEEKLNARIDRKLESRKAALIWKLITVAGFIVTDGLVLGAWGCGAFLNDPRRTAKDFQDALENEFRGTFSEVIFAIVDWSTSRRFLGHFRQVFYGEGRFSAL